MSESRHIDGKYSKKDQLDNEFPTGPTFGLRCIFVCLEIVEVSDQRHQAKKSSKDKMRGRDFPFTVSPRLKLNGEFIIISCSLPIQLYQLLLEEKREANGSF